ncbi:MAG: LysR family transcriptional regulator [Ruminococcus sp.]|nr:LysR family transcriptional regulator [Ruminococcus sp.]
MNLTHLRYMVEVERQGSITKAAAALYMGQPNLSKAIKEMEIEVGIPIFKRSAKGVVPTEKGQEFLQYAKAIIVQMDKMESLYKDTNENAIDFQLMVPRASYVAYSFTEFLKKLENAESMDIRFKETNSFEAIDSIVECSCSLAIIRYEAQNEEYFTSLLNEKNIKAQELWSYDYMVLMSKSSPLTASRVLDEKDLSEYIEILHGDTELPGSSALQRRSRRLNSHKRHIYVFERGSQFDILRSNPQTFMYVSPLPKKMLAELNLVQRPIVQKNKRNRDALISLSSYRFSKTDTLFVDEVKKVIADIKRDEGLF